MAISPHTRRTIEARDTDRRPHPRETEAAAKIYARASEILEARRAGAAYDPEDEMSDLLEPLGEIPRRPSKLKTGLAALRLANQIRKGTKHMKGSWKTSLFGILGTIGIALSNADGPAWLAIAGQVLMGAAALGAGMSARDNAVSSEEAGAKK